MDHDAALLALISGLYAQLATAQQEVATLRAQQPDQPATFVSSDPNDGPAY